MLQSTDATSASCPIATMAILAKTRCSRVASWSPFDSKISPMSLYPVPSQEKKGNHSLRGCLDLSDSAFQLHQIECLNMSFSEISASLANSWVGVS
ncbi:hypothetical protein ACH5RR_008876 [Cinchona calisaya]|uniref:Uncharacterized protein n=1 Tax=Cinchona calisaya TaxID=153742 RepID=A0ABD3ACZ9_9GENT